MNNKKKKRRGFTPEQKSIFFSILVLFGLSINLTTSYIFNQYPWYIYLVGGIGLYKALLPIVKPINKKLITMSSIMSVIYILSFFVAHYGTIDNIFLNSTQFIKSLLVCGGYTAGTYILLSYGIILLNTISQQKKKVQNLLYKKPILLAFIIIILCYIPVLIVFYPGVVMGDGFDELRQYLHNCTWSINYINLIDKAVYINSHHSPFHTVLLGGIYSFFNNFMSSTNSIFMYVIIQVLLQAFALSYSIKIMYKLKINNIFIIISLIIYCFLPFFSINAVGVYKDIMFSILILLYTCSLIEFTYLKETKSKDLIKVVILALLVSLICNKGIFVVLLTTLFLLFKYRKEKKLLVWFVVPVLFYGIYSKVMLPALHVTPGSIRETLAIPIQQVARYVVYYGDEITPKEKKAISGLLEYEKIAERYQPDFADAIKNKLFNKDYTKKELKDFISVWLKLFTKHPTVYISSYANMTYGYLFYNQRNGVVYFISNSGRSCDNLAEEFKQKNESLIEIIQNKVILAQYIPIIGALLNVSFYNWLLILMIVYLISNGKKHRLIPLIPSFVVLLFCFVSPVNGNKRYIYPIIYSTPILIAYTSAVINEKKNKTNK